VRRGHHQPSAEPGADPAGNHHAGNRRYVNQSAKQDDEDDALGDRRDGMADIERARNVFVLDEVKEPEDRCRGCKRPDPQRVEEVGRSTES